MYYLAYSNIQHLLILLHSDQLLCSFFQVIEYERTHNTVGQMNAARAAAAAQAAAVAAANAAGQNAVPGGKDCEEDTQHAGAGRR